MAEDANRDFRAVQAEGSRQRQWLEVLQLPQVFSEFLSQHELEMSQNQVNSPGKVDLWASGDGAWRAGEDKLYKSIKSEGSGIIYFKSSCMALPQFKSSPLEVPKLSQQSSFPAASHASSRGTNTLSPTCFPMKKTS